nr:MAG TPA: hypothetical protein [Bacteriophage sp.]
MIFCESDFRDSCIACLFSSDRRDSFVFETVFKASD